MTPGVIREIFAAHNQHDPPEGSDSANALGVYRVVGVFSPQADAGLVLRRLSIADTRRNSCPRVVCRNAE